MAELLLLQAAAIGDIDEVRRLLKAGHDIDERGNPLTKEELKRLRWLVNEAGVNAAASALGQPFDYTPLMAALGEGHFEVAGELLHAGADPNATDSLKRTPLMLAIGWKQADLAEQLIAGGAEVNAKDLSGSPVLTQAIEAGLWEIAHALLNAGADPAPRGKKDCLPISAALYQSGEKASGVVLRLLEGGAVVKDPEQVPVVTENHGENVVAAVLDAFPQWIDTISADELLRSAAKQRKLAILKLLIERGARPTNSKSESSPLIDVIIGPARSSLDFYNEEFITDEREVACMQVLVEAGADVNHSGGDRGYPLRWAVEFYRSELCRWLLEHGADPNLCADGETPLEAAFKKLDEAMPKYELDAGETEKFQRLEAEARKIISLLQEHGGQRGSTESRGAADNGAEDDDDMELEILVLATPVAERRGLCDATFCKAHQIMIQADIDKIADMLEKDKKVIRMERDAHRRLKKLEPPVGDMLALVKLKGQPWVYVSGGRRPRGDSPMKAWSKQLRAPVLYAGEESVSGAVFYALYEGGQCVESFESDGVWFDGGIEIDLEVDEESDRMHGTTFHSLLRDADAIDWTAYASEWDFLDRFLRERDAYLTFISAGSASHGEPIEVIGYHDDELTAANVERIDIAYYEPTALQQRAAATPPPQEDPLYEAIKAGNLNAAKNAVDAGVDLNQLLPRSRTSYLVTAIACSMYQGSAEIVDLLLQSGADPNFGGSGPPLTRLMTSGSRTPEQMEVLLKLLIAGADINGRKVADSNNPFFPGGESALHNAAQRGSVNFVKLLLRHGADISLIDGAGRTPLETARAWLKSVKMDRIQEVPAFTSELDAAMAQETVDVLTCAERGELDFRTLPTDEELIQAERHVQAERRRM